MKAVKLLPCPYCGSEAVIKEHNEKDGYKVICTNKENCIGNMHYLWSKTEDEAVKVWNGRVLG